MVISSEALDGYLGYPDYAPDKHTERGNEERRSKRQALYANHGYGEPGYGPNTSPSMYYPRYHRYGPTDEDQYDPSKPRIKVHVETEKKSTISRTQSGASMAKKKRQLLGLTSFVSPVQPSLQAHTSQEEHNGFAKSEVSKQRDVREEPIEVPIRAEEHHGVVNSKSRITEDGESKKSTIQRIQKRVADDTNHAQLPVKRQYVYNSEPEVARATVKGSRDQNNPIGNLIKMIAGQSSKNILGLNSKSFDVFPGPLPTGGDKSAWNTKGAEAAREQGMGQGRQRQTSSFAPQNRERLAEMYSQAGLVMDQTNQRRADAAKREAKVEAIREQDREQEREQEREQAGRQALQQAKAAEMVASQAAAAAQQQRMNQERSLEREESIEREQEYEHERANELAELAVARQQQLSSDTQDEMTSEAVQRHVAPQPESEIPDRQSDYGQMLPRDGYMPLQSESDLFRGHMRMPFARYPYQNDEGYMPMAQMAPMAMMPPTMSPFMPTPTMFLMPRVPYMPMHDPTESMMQDHIQQPMFAHSQQQLFAHENDHVAQEPLHPQRRNHYIPHHESRYHMPTSSPYDPSLPDEDEDDDKPEVHVHIQTEKSQIAKAAAAIKGKDKLNRKPKATNS